MTPSDVVTWIGTTVSVFSAGYAVLQAKRAKSAVHIAESLREQIISRYEGHDLQSLEPLVKAAQEAMRKYAMPATTSARRGSTPGKDANAVIKLNEEISLKKHILEKFFGREIGTFQNDFTNLISNFRFQQNDEEQASLGGEIHRMISDFSGELKAVLDKNIFEKHLQL
jgi:hypothetical protein